MAIGGEVAEGVYRLGDRRVNWWLVVDGGKATLVDAGLPGQYGQLGSLLARLGLTVADVDAVVVTHGHIDHLACIAPLRDDTDVDVRIPRADQSLAATKPKLDPKVMAHSLNVAALRTAASYARQGVLRARPVRDSRPLDDGEVLDVPGRPTFIAAPGHTDGSGMFLLAERDVLFSGDVLVTLDPFSDTPGPRTLPAFDNVDHALAVASLDLVAKTGVATVLPGHGEPWVDGAEEAAAQARVAS